IVLGIVRSAGLDFSKQPHRKPASNIAAAALRFLWLRGYWAEGRQLLGTLLDRRADDVPLDVLSEAIKGAGVLAHAQGSYHLADDLLKQSLALARATGEAQRVAAVLNNLGDLARNRGDYQRARTYHRKSLAAVERSGDRD